MALFRPEHMVSSVTELTIDWLRQAGITALLLDLDGTLARRKSQEPFEGVVEWIQFMQESGIALTVVSNANPSRVVPFAQSLGLPFRYLSMKPFPLGMELGRRSLCSKRRQTAMVGDQFLNDMLGAHLGGFRSIFVIPPEGHAPLFPFLKGVESWLLKRYRERKEQM